MMKELRVHSEKFKPLKVPKLNKCALHSTSAHTRSEQRSGIMGFVVRGTLKKINKINIYTSYM